MSVLENTRVRVDSETNLRDILDKVHEIHIDHVDDTHFFTLSQVYEDLLLKMGEKNSDGGQFFAPREVIRAMVHTLNPQLSQRFTIRVATPVVFWRLLMNTLLASWAIAPLVRISTLSNTIPFLAVKRKIWCSRLPWPIWCYTALISLTCGMATR
jgi:hypothetical protein